MESATGALDHCTAIVSPLMRDRRIVLYCRDDSSLDRLRAALSSYVVSRKLRTWKEFDELAVHDAPLVAIIPRITLEEFDGIRAFRQKHSKHPIVVVTEKDADNVRTLAPVCVDEFVWTSEAPQWLSTAVCRARNEGFFVRLAHLLTETTTLDPVIRLALVRALERAHPVRSVRHLAVLSIGIRPRCGDDGQRRVTPRISCGPRIASRGLS